MSQRAAGFKGEYLWEFEVAAHHLLALADAIPADRYAWRPAGDARSVSDVFVHIAAGNFILLDLAGTPAPQGLYSSLHGEGEQRFFALVMQNQALEKRVTEKADVADMLKRSLDSWRNAFDRIAPDGLDRPGRFFGEETTVRRVYMRLLAHTHEHMGQLIAYARVMGLPAPWPDPLEEVKENLG